LWSFQRTTVDRPFVFLCCGEAPEVALATGGASRWRRRGVGGAVVLAKRRRRRGRSRERRARGIDAPDDPASEENRGDGEVA
jgi:hypothetical protein